VKARDAIKAVANALYHEAVDKHAEGMTLIQRSARLEQISKIASDAEAEAVVDVLIEEGLILVEEPEEDIWLTSEGGDA
jgi:hypothetical protein